MKLKCSWQPSLMILTPEFRLTAIRGLSFQSGNSHYSSTPLVVKEVSLADLQIEPAIHSNRQRHDLAAVSKLLHLLQIIRIAHGHRF